MLHKNHFHYQLFDFNTRILPEDRIDNIMAYYNEQRESNPYPKLQSKLFAKIDQQLKSVILTDSDRYTKALFKQFQHKKCHNWLQTDPWLLSFSFVSESVSCELIMY